MPVSRPFTAITAVAAFVALAFSATAMAQAPDQPEDYRVTLDSVPPVAVDIADLNKDNLDEVQKYCTLPGIPPAIDTPFPCVDFPISVADAGVTVTGAAVNQVNGRTGQFSLSCDFVFPGTSSVTVKLPADYVPKPEDVTLDALSGNGPLGCSWSIVFAGDPSGSLSGTAKGTVAIARVPGQQQVATSVRVDVKITSGTGRYATAVGGSGTYADVYTSPWSPETANSTKPTSRAAARTGARTAADGELVLRLGSKKSNPAAVPVVSALAKGDPRKFRVVADKGSKCSATATKGSKKVSFGSAKVGKTAGTANFPSTIRSKLTKAGKWKISSSCTKSGKKKSAPSLSVTVK